VIMATPALIKATPGQWVEVKVPVDSWPVTIQFGDEKPEPAFIDHRLNQRGQVEAVAKRRCPDLAPGRYRVKVYTSDGVETAQLHVG